MPDRSARTPPRAQKPATGADKTPSGGPAKESSPSPAKKSSPSPAGKSSPSPAGKSSPSPAKKSSPSPATKPTWDLERFSLTRLSKTRQSTVVKHTDPEFAFVADAYSNALRIAERKEGKAILSKLANDCVTRWEDKKNANLYGNYVWPGDKSMLKDNSLIRIFLDQMRTHPPPVVIDGTQTFDDGFACTVGSRSRSTDIANFQPSKVIMQFEVNYMIVDAFNTINEVLARDRPANVKDQTEQERYDRVRASYKERYQKLRCFLMGIFWHEIAGHAFVAFIAGGSWPSTPAENNTLTLINGNDSIGESGNFVEAQLIDGTMEVRPFPTKTTTDIKIYIYKEDGSKVNITAQVAESFVLYPSTFDLALLRKLSRSPSPQPQGRSPPEDTHKRPQSSDGIQPGDARRQALNEARRAKKWSSWNVKLGNTKKRVAILSVMEIKAS